jgi:hypothetical protein
VFAAVNDIAGETAKTERKATGEVESGADGGQDGREDEQGAAQFARGKHFGIVWQIALCDSISTDYRRGTFRTSPFRH